MVRVLFILVCFSLVGFGFSPELERQRNTLRSEMSEASARLQRRLTELDILREHRSELANNLASPRRLAQIQDSIAQKEKALVALKAEVDSLYRVGRWVDNWTNEAQMRALARKNGESLFQGCLKRVPLLPVSFESRLFGTDDNYPAEQYARERQLVFAQRGEAVLYTE